MKEIENEKLHYSTLHDTFYFLFLFTPIWFEKIEMTAWRLVNGISKPPADSQTQSAQFTHFGCARKFNSLFFFSLIQIHPHLSVCYLSPSVKIVTHILLL